MFEELPSESTWRRRILYLGEGLLIGTGGTYLLILVAGLLRLTLEGPPTLGPILFGVFLLLLGYRFQWALDSDRRAGFSPVDPPTSAVAVDWSATRRWSWVALTSILAGGLSFGVSLYIWGWEAVIYNNRGLEVFALAVFLGLGLVVYGLYDPRDSDRPEPESEG